MAEYSWLIDDIETLSTYTKDGYTRAVLNQAVQAIRKLSAKVQPVRHGQWKPGDMPTYGGFKCSLCKKNTIVYKPPFCPNCGAKMDGGET